MVPRSSGDDGEITMLRTLRQDPDGDRTAVAVRQALEEPIKIAGGLEAATVLGAIDPSTGSLVVYGGKTDCGLIDDVWTLDLATAQWRTEVEATIGEACLRGDQPGQCTTLCI